jgi:hypothetical protein
MSALHDEKGKFRKGNPGGPGRPKKEREITYYRILELSVSENDWAEICKKAAEQAKRGDAVARKWISDYLIGSPIQRMEHSGAEGGALDIVVTYVNKPAADSTT